MFALVAAASAEPAEPVRALPQQQARAVVRIVRPAVVRAGAAIPEESIVRMAKLRDANDSRPSKLIEFY